MKIKRNILLTPGPATTTDKIKMAQVVPDICPRENEFSQLITSIMDDLLSLVAKKTNNYACTLFGGSGTAAVEIMLASTIGPDDCVLIINNGEYGNRMVKIAEIHKLNFVEYKSSTRKKIDIDNVKQIITNNHRNKISHIAVVHHETTTGLLNDLEELSKLANYYQLELLVDAISSYAAIPIDIEKMPVGHLAATSNKNLQSMAGIAFVISRISSLEKCKDYKKKSLYLDLYAQYHYLLNTGQFRFTPPVQTLYALKEAIDELLNETLTGRYSRYSQSWNTLVDGMDKLGFKQYVPLEYQSKLICTFYELDNFDFVDFHDYLYERNITIYPGKIHNENTFRIGTIGDIDYSDIELVLGNINHYLKKE